MRQGKPQRITYLSYLTLPKGIRCTEWRYQVDCHTLSETIGSVSHSFMPVLEITNTNDMWLDLTLLLSVH